MYKNTIYEKELEKNMIQDLKNEVFDNHFTDIKPLDDDYIFVFRGHGKKDDTLLMSKADGFVSLPKYFEIKDNLIENEYIYLFSISKAKFFLAKEKSTEKLEYKLENNLAKPGMDGQNVECMEYSFYRIKELRKSSPQNLCFAGLTAYHLFVWYRDNQYCGRCATKVIHDHKERMLKCPTCGNMIFPKICPAVIIGLRDGDRLMMSRYANREYKGRALLAGFCEIGETPEETVVREVMEEVGLKATNVTYFGSQPWGIDCNLLLGYYADVSGDVNVTIDKEELAAASFVKREDIEPEPITESLTATMIEEFRCGRW